MVSLQPCGGRNNLFSIYDRRSEFEGKNVAFVADKDTYRFESIPIDKAGIIFTSGYCIENDIYGGSNISSFLDEEDLPRHQLLKDIVGKWFSFEVERFMNRECGNSLSVSNHINVVCPVGLEHICPHFAETIGYREPSAEILELVLVEYDLNVRGKQLFQMLSRFLSSKGRFSSFSEKNLIEIALKQGENHFLERIAIDIKRSLGAAQP